MRVSSGALDSDDDDSDDGESVEGGDGEDGDAEAPVYREATGGESSGV